MASVSEAVMFTLSLEAIPVTELFSDARETKLKAEYANNGRMGYH